MSKTQGRDSDILTYFGVLAVPQTAPMSSIPSIYQTLSELDFKPVPAETIIDKWKKNGDNGLPLNGPAFAAPTYLFFFTGDSRNNRPANDLTIRKAFSLMEYCEPVIAVQISQPTVSGGWAHWSKPGAADISTDRPYVKPTIWTLG